MVFVQIYVAKDGLVRRNQDVIFGDLNVDQVELFCSDAGPSASESFIGCYLSGEFLAALIAHLVLVFIFPLKVSDVSRRHAYPLTKLVC